MLGGLLMSLGACEKCWENPCECEGSWLDKLRKLADEADQLRAEVERLRKLCAERPGVVLDDASKSFVTWVEDIDAAGRGEG
jgi:hypothetical protein